VGGRRMPQPVQDELPDTETDQNRGRSLVTAAPRSRSPTRGGPGIRSAAVLRGVVRVRMIRTWRLRRITGRSNS
jgi:hypothetical protein